MTDGQTYQLCELVMNLFQLFVVSGEHLMSLEEEMIFELGFSHLIFLVQLSFFHFPNGRLSSSQQLLLLLQKLLLQKRDFLPADKRSDVTDGNPVPHRSHTCPAHSWRLKAHAFI